MRVISVGVGVGVIAMTKTKLVVLSCFTEGEGND